MGLLSFLFGKTQNTKSTPKVNISFSSPLPSNSFEAAANAFEAQANAEAEKIAEIDARCKRSEHGLTVSQILLLEYCKKGKYPNPEGGYQRFWWFQYGVRSVGAVLNQLEWGGFIRYALPLDVLTTLKVDQLKNILQNLQLPATGKKADLIDRIKQNVDNDTLKQFVHPKKYTLTELGELELAANAYVPYIHTHKWPEVSVWDVNKNADLRHWKDYIWGCFNKKSMEYAAKGQWGLYQNVRLSMADFLYDDSRYTDSFAMYGEVCFYDVNGDEFFIDYDDPSDLLPIGIITRMKKTAKEANLSEAQMREILQNRIGKLRPIKQRVPKGQMVDLILNKMSTTA